MVISVFRTLLGILILIRIIAFTIVTLKKTNQQTNKTNKQTNKTFILTLALQALHYDYKEIILMLPNTE